MEDAWEEEVEEGPEFCQVVLEGRAREQHSVVGIVGLQGSAKKKKRKERRKKKGGGGGWGEE